MKTLKEFYTFLQETTYSRFDNIQDLQSHFKSFLGVEIYLELSSDDYGDYKLIANLTLNNDRDLYLDLYYILDRQNQLYITEFNLDGEHALTTYHYNYLIS
jgi:hypothetical protein